MNHLTPDQRANLRKTLYEIRWHTKQLEYYSKVNSDRKFNSILGKQETENKGSREG